MTIILSITILENILGTNWDLADFVRLNIQLVQMN